MQILVVEDEPRLAEAIAQILKEKKYMVDIANDGRDGFDLAVSGAYDCIIPDVNHGDSTAIAFEKLFGNHSSRPHG
ncbi:MAG: response regulator [Ruminococcaceae bacterium]|nr:response regulator [Oscillospiraceae bacterium]